MERIMILCLLSAILIATKFTLVSGSECMRRKFFEITVNYYGGVTINRTVKCDMYFQWTVADYCCYDKWDRFERNPFCCYSETYKLVLAVGFICLVLLGCSLSIFLCWIYNLPHYLLYCFSCGKFRLNDWTSRTNKNSPYVDPSFYSGEPFWARGAEMQHYPLRPMPPKVFYPAPPQKLKYRWDMAHGELPLFIVASRQFTRNPYSARPQDRHTTPPYHDSNNNNSESRRNSLSSVNETGKKGRHEDNKSQGNYSAQYNRHRRGTTASSTRKISHGETVSSASSRRSVPDHVQYNPPPFGANIDEVDAAQELMEALKFFDDEDRNSESPVQWKNENKSQNEEPKSLGGRQEIFIISRDNSVVGCPPSGANGARGQGFNMDSVVRPNTTGSLGTFDQYGNYMSLSHMGLSDSQRLKINSRGGSSNNPLGVSVYGMPGVHTSGLLTTVQNYHVVSSNLGNPMETILEDDSMDEQPTKADVDEGIGVTSSASSLSSSSTEARSSGNSSSVASSKVTNRFNAQKEQRLARLEANEGKPGLKRRASTISTVSRATAAGSPVMSASINHVLGPTPTSRAFVPFNPTLPGSLSEHSTASFEESCNDPDCNKPRRNSVV